MSKLNIVILNLPNYPNGFAVVEKFKQINKIFVENSDSVRIINRHPIVSNSIGTKKNYMIGHFEGTIFINTITSSTNKISKYIKTIYGLCLEILLLKKLAKQNNNFIFVSYDLFPLTIYYSIIARLFNYKLVINIMEYHKAINYQSLFKNINARLFDNYSFYFAHKIIVISNKLLELVKKKYPQKPVFKLPVLADFTFSSKFEEMNELPYLLYCGNIGYYEVIKFILTVWEKIKNKTSFKLKLILHGNTSNINRFIMEINKLDLDSRIEVKCNLSKDELFKNYYSAYTFLAPLRPILQDEYRFPQKLAEFCSIKRPIITTNYGEVKNYFNDKENAFIASEYSIESFSAKVMEAIHNPELSKRIALNAYQLGLKNFDYRNYMTSLRNFLINNEKVI